MKVKGYALIFSSLLIVLISFYYCFQQDTFNINVACPQRQYTAKSASVCIGNASSVIFYKTHKTGSSSVSSILWRKLCSSTDLNCFLPSDTNPGKIWDFSKYSDWHYSVWKPGTSGTAPFNVWLHHIHLQDYAGQSSLSSNGNYLHQIMKSPTFHVSIVRRPAYRFQSAWYWYGHNSRFHMDLPSFVRKLVAYEADDCTVAARINADLNLKYRTGLDATSEELTGHNIMTDPQAFTSSYNSLMSDNSIFLMVCDRFDESLLVLSVLMHWEQSPAKSQQECLNHDCLVCYGSPIQFSNMLYLKKKVQTYNNSLTEEEADLLDRYQPFDSQLYSRANEQLDAYIAVIGKEWFEKELRNFQTLLQVLYEYCANKCYSTQELTPGCHSSGKAHSTKLLMYMRIAHMDGRGEEYCESLSRDNRDNVQSIRKAMRKKKNN